MNLTADSLSIEPVIANVVVARTAGEVGALTASVDPTRPAGSVAQGISGRSSLILVSPNSVGLNLVRIEAQATKSTPSTMVLSNLLAHDLYHLVQWTILGNGKIAGFGAKTAAEPRWLLEAAPEWFAENLMRSNGFPELAEVVDAAVAQRAVGFPGLEEWEDAEGYLSLTPPTNKMPSGIRFGMLNEVAQLLVDRAGQQALLFDYWKARAVTNEPWTTTFQTVFGVSVSGFYKEVDAHFDRIARRSTTSTTR